MRARATSARFLMMYCPSMVGVMNPAHPTLGRRTSGPKVVNMCASKRAMFRLVNLGIKKRIPMNISTNPRMIKNGSKLIEGRVTSKSDATSPSAGLIMSTLRKPNQKNITNMEIRPIQSRRPSVRNDSFIQGHYNKTPLSGCVCLKWKVFLHLHL